jgi:erythromycin esterase-like protein
MTCLGLSRADEPAQAELDWVRKNALQLDGCEAGKGFKDLAPLRKLIGDARIVSLGEGTHGTREFFQMKHRLTEFLASEMGFTIFSIEANLPEAYRLNDFVLEGKGDPRELIAGMYFWTWNTEEVLDLVLWMREFNRTGKGRIEFTGFDMQTHKVAAAIARGFLEKADPELAKKAGDVYARMERIRGSGGGGGSFGVATGQLPVDPAKGKKLRYRGWLRTEGVTRGWAGLWARVDGEKGILAFDNMQDRGVKGTTDWKEHEIVLTVPEAAVNINFGAILTGDGRAWFDELSVDLDEKPYEGAPALDLDFEGGAIKAFRTGGDGYVVRIDDQVARSGAKSLRIGHQEAATPGAAGEIDGSEASRLCREVLERMTASRDAYAKASSEKETDWAIQNARVVLQCAQMHANEVTRDESMARNVQWILDRAPAGTKIVLWAHNGHVARNRSYGKGAMGWFLDQWYGKEQVVLGFAAGEGKYTAMVQGKGLHSDNPLQPPQPRSFEEYFRKSSLSSFILDLRPSSKEDPASAWARRLRPFRSIGALAMKSQFFPADACAHYDALIYFDRTSASRPLKENPPAK